MSLLTPERVPVSVYKWSDAGAPVLDKSAGCLSAIIATCLVTGYGGKAGAGWGLVHEDLSTKTKVMSFTDMAGIPLSLRLRNETTTSMSVQLVKDVVTANTATVLSECGTTFKFTGSKLTGEWMVVATDRGFCFFAQTSHTRAPATETGVFLFAGMAAGMLSSAFVIKHTGGTNTETNADRYGITVPVNGAYSVDAAVYVVEHDVFDKKPLESMWNGIASKTPLPMAAPMYAYASNDIYQLPIYAPSRSDFENFDSVGVGFAAVNFCTSTQYQSNKDNVYVPLDFWSY